MDINIEKVKSLIQQSANYLAEAELLEENGWSEEDVKLLNYIATTDFEIQFKEEER